MTNNQLQKYSKTEIVNIKDLKQIIKIKGMAEAVEVFHKAQNSIHEAQQAQELKLRAIRQAGIILLPPDEGGMTKREERKRTDLSASSELTQFQDTLEQAGITRETANIWQKVGKIPESKFEAYFTEKDYYQNEFTIAGLLRFAGHILVSKFTGEEENYTPEEIIILVRLVLGSIDLDPASNDFAQQIIKAKKYFTEEDDGLSKPWHGNVFLNPPYQMPKIRDFTDKLISELPNLKAAILLTNNNTDTKWFYKCADNSELICFTLGRINFYKTDKEKTYPTNGQSFFYFGSNSSKFLEIFSKIGLIMKVAK